MSRFSMRSICNQLGESIGISGVTLGYNTRGDLLSGAGIFSGVIISSVIVEIASAEDDMVKEGILRNGDITVWIDESDSTPFIRNRSIIHWSNTHYVIMNTIVNKGHIELYAKKEGV